MKRILLFLTIVMGAALVMSLFRNTTPSDSQWQDTSNTTTASPPTSPIVDSLRAGGNTFLDPQGLYSFLYPNDYVLDTSDSVHPRVYKRAESQRPQSEISDGALIVFESIDLSSQTLEQWVDAYIKQSTADGTAHVTQPKKAITLNGFPGFSYEQKGLTDSTYVVLQKNKQSTAAVLIVYAISDPQGKNYRSEVEAILSTVELVK